MKNRVRKYINTLIEHLNNIDQNQITDVYEVLKEARDNGSTIFICGNGGTSATASHFTGDLIKGASYNKDKRFKVICLNDNIPALSAYSNDVSYEVAYVEQLKNFLQKGDVVIGISGSGNSINILNVINFANENSAKTVSIVGFENNKLQEISNYVIHANCNHMLMAEDIHMIFTHILTSLFMESESC